MKEVVTSVTIIRCIWGDMQICPLYIHVCVCVCVCARACVYRPRMQSWILVFTIFVFLECTGGAGGIAVRGACGAGNYQRLVQPQFTPDAGIMSAMRVTQVPSVRE